MIRSSLLTSCSYWFYVSKVSLQSTLTAVSSKIKEPSSPFAIQQLIYSPPQRPPIRDCQALDFLDLQIISLGFSSKRDFIVGLIVESPVIMMGIFVGSLRWVLSGGGDRYELEFLVKSKNSFYS